MFNRAPQGPDAKPSMGKALAFTFAVAVLILGLGWLVHYRITLETEAAITRTQEQATTEQKHLVQNVLSEVAANANLLAHVSSSSLETTPASSPLALDHLRAEFLDFAKTRTSFNRVILLKADGSPVIEIERLRAPNGSFNFHEVEQGASPRPIDAPWVNNLGLLATSERVAFLPVDLGNNGDSAWQPVLRVAAPVYGDRRNQPIAYVVLDYLVDTLFTRIDREDSRLDSHTMVVDTDGNWLRDWQPNSLTRPQTPPMTTFAPDIWRTILTTPNGSYLGRQGLISYDTINFTAPDRAWAPQTPLQGWKLMTWLDSAALGAKLRDATESLWWSVAMAIGLLMPVTYLVVSAREQQRQTWRAKEQARALLQSITDTSITGIVSGEAIRNGGKAIVAFRTSFINPAAELMLANLLGDDDIQVFPRDLVPGFFDHCVEVATTGDRCELEQSSIGGPHGRKWFHLLIVKLNDGVVVTISDITQQKKTVDELHSAKEAAEIANRAKSQFLALMGHEIRTPMNGLLGFASLLEKTPLNQEQKDYVSTLRLSGEALLKILEDILDYSHMENESLDMKRVPVDLREVVRQISQLFTLASGDRNIELSTKVSPDVPPYIIGDDVRLRQILVNLVGNALKFTTEGFILIKVARQETELGSFVRFHVVDSGPGIPIEMIDRLFKPFSQVESTFSRRFGGTGLGLSICKRLVETMGGEVGVQTTPGKGSDFFFTLPIKLPNFPSGKALDPSLDGVDQRTRILVVDDDSINRKLMLHMIDKVGMTAEAVASGEEALEMVRRIPYELILMDMQMPRMDGLEATRRIRAFEAQHQRPSPSRICALTANSAQDDRDRCFAAGMDEFLAKPVGLHDLQEVIRRISC